MNVRYFIEELMCSGPVQRVRAPSIPAAAHHRTMTPYMATLSGFITIYQLTLLNTPTRSIIAGQLRADKLVHSANAKFYRLSIRSIVHV